MHQHFYAPILDNGQLSRLDENGEDTLSESAAAFLSEKRTEITADTPLILIREAEKWVGKIGETWYDLENGQEKNEIPDAWRTLTVEKTRDLVQEAKEKAAQELEIPQVALPAQETPAEPAETSEQPSENPLEEAFAEDNQPQESAEAEATTRKARSFELLPKPNDTSHNFRFYDVTVVITFPNASSYASTAEDDASVFDDMKGKLRDIAGQYGYDDIYDKGAGNCDAAAKEMENILKINNQKGATVTLKWVPGKGHIWSDMANRSVGTNGFHTGVLYEGRVYCNVHPSSLPYDPWVADFNMSLALGNVKLSPIISEF